MNVQKIRLREWDHNDAPVVALYANNPRIASNLRDGFPYPYSLKDARSFISTALTDTSSAKLFAIDLEGRSIGSIGAMFKDDIYRLNVEIGYWLAEEFWGKGYTSRAIELITTYIFDNYDTERVYAEPFSDNTGSRRALEKAGFREEAYFRRNIIKNGVIKDSCIYAILRAEWQEIKGL